MHRLHDVAPEDTVGMIRAGTEIAEEAGSFCLLQGFALAGDEERRTREEARWCHGSSSLGGDANMRTVRWILGLLLVVGWALSVAAGSPAGVQTRVAAQRALDGVAYSHQVVPQGTAAPAFENAYPAGASKAKVEKALLESNALDVYWHRPITGDQLQAEMDRMVKGSRDKKVLKEMFAALGNDPQAIAEDLARPLLADRLCRQWYARDERFHGDLKARAEQELKGLTAQTLRSTDGQYTEYELKENTSGKPVADPSQFGVLDPAAVEDVPFKSRRGVARRKRADAPRTFPWARSARLQEDDTRFYALAVLEATPQSVKVALVQWPKVPFDEWLSQQRGKLGVQEPAVLLSMPYHLAPVPETASGANDTWSPMTQVPQDREDCSSVWTGTEMIVWGGTAGAGYHRTPVAGTTRPRTPGPSRPR